METNNRANWYSFQGNRWLGFYLDLIGSLIILVISFQFVLKKETSSPGNGKLFFEFYHFIDKKCLYFLIANS